MNHVLTRTQEQAALDNQFRRDILHGLQQPQKQLSPKYFYDAVGSDLFTDICALDEYYPYRTELAMLPDVARDLADILEKPQTIIEFGAGALVKIRPILTHIPSIRAFWPMDISGDHLSDACAGLSADFPKVRIDAIEGDFTQKLVLPDHGDGELTGFFPGSTIGNFHPDDARGFLQNVHDALGIGSQLIIGVDTRKSAHKLHAAYNDGAGVTAAFNKNILQRIADIFDTRIDMGAFDHYAYFNPREKRIEMHLVANRPLDILLGDQLVHFDGGESIHTENSYKYNQEDFRQLADSANWKIARSWYAPDDMFSMYLLKAV